MPRFLYIKKELIIAGFALLFFILIVPLITYVYFANSLESPEKIMNRNDSGILLLDRNDKPFFSFYSAKQKEIISLSQVPKYTLQAIIASEDKDFYSHPGFSPKAIVRAFIFDIFHKNVFYGGSTITQQLVKNTLLTSQKSFMRKYQEIILANEIERRYSKNQILQMYINSAYFGDGSFGIQEASQRDFGKNASELTIGESALLSGILSAPSKYSPISGDRSGALKRQKIVLSEMVDQKYITPSIEKKALEQHLAFTKVSDIINAVAPHFALMVRDQLIQKYGEELIVRSGFKVKTTLDVNWQKIAQDEVAKQVELLKNDKVSNGTAVVEDPRNGEIRVLVGSADWNNPENGKYNVAIAKRQPGSSFKPIVYVSALEKHFITPATILKDMPITYDLHPGTYSPRDFDDKFRGPVTVRRALANSLNVPAVAVLNMLGIPSAIEMGKRLGISTLQDPSNYGLSLVLGAAEVKLLELTNVYATFANQGIKNNPTIITQIIDKNATTIFDYKPEQKRVLDPVYPFLISSILSDNKTRAEEFGNLLTINRTAAVKTGTTSDFKDSWTLGYTPSLTIGVWVGNNDNSPMDNIAGSLGAAPIWRHLMETFLADSPPEHFDVPSGIITENICASNGLLAKGATSSAISEFFVKGTQPTTYCYFPSESFSANLPTPSQNNDSSQLPASPQKSHKEGDGKEKLPN